MDALKIFHFKIKTMFPFDGLFAVLTLSTFRNLRQFACLWTGLGQRQRGMKGSDISLPSEQQLHVVFILYMRKIMKQYYPIGWTSNL